RRHRPGRADPVEPGALHRAAATAGKAARRSRRRADHRPAGPREAHTGRARAAGGGAEGGGGEAEPPLTGGARPRQGLRILSATGKASAPFSVYQVMTSSSGRTAFTDG